MPIIDVSREFFPHPKSLLIDLVALACGGLDEETGAMLALAKWTARLAKEGLVPWGRA